MEPIGVYNMLRSLTLVYLTSQILEKFAFSSCIPPLFVSFRSHPLSLSLSLLISHKRGDDEWSQCGKLNCRILPGLCGPRLSSLRGTFFPNSIKELVISEGGPDGPNYTNLSVGAGKKSLLSGSNLLLLSGRYDLSVGNLCLWKLCSQAVHVTAQFSFTPVVLGPVAAFLLWGEHWQLILNLFGIASL